MTATRLYYLGLSAICVGLCGALCIHFLRPNTVQWWVVWLFGIYAIQPILNLFKEYYVMLRSSRATPDLYTLIDNKGISL